MSFVAAATSVGAWALGTGAAAGIGSTIVGGALIGAGVGGAYSALTGDGKILDSMLTGAGIGGLAGGVGGALFPGAAGYAPAAGGVGATANVPAVTAYGPPKSAMDTGVFGPPKSAMMGAENPSWWSALSGGEKLGVGLGATTLLGLLGGQQEGIATQGDKGNIRPYEFSSARREPEAGESYYFQPIEYDKYGKATKPLDTSERNYFDQKYTAQPIYQAANGGQIPQLNNMPAGGLASLQGMRDGYAPMTTFDGDIPQFADGGYTYDPAKQRYNEIAPQVAETPKRRSMFDLLLRRGVRGDEAFQSFGNPLTDPLAYDIGRQYSHLFAGLKIPQAEQQISNKYTFDPQSRTYKSMAEGGVTNMQDGGFVVPADTVSHFGNGSTDAGLKLLGSRLGAKPIKGRGDGMSDSISAMINGKQPARIADGEAYVPPEMVKKIGKGSSETGAKRLYKMMDKVRHARTGTKKQGKQIKADKYLPT